jgi:hypothetical protein
MDPFTQIVEGLWLGTTDYPPRVERFGVVLTVVPSAAPVDDGVRHRLWDPKDGTAQLKSDIAWVAEHWRSGKTVLVRSQGQERAAHIIQHVLVDLGATPHEARDLIRARRPEVLKESA